MRSAVCVFLVFSGCMTADALTDEQIAEAIRYGQQYRTPDLFMRDGLKAKKVQLASAMAMDGISKYVMFYRDADVVSAAAAAANLQLRTFTIADARQIPDTGLVFANIQLQARGMIPVKKLNKRYPEGRGHFVLRVDGVVIQPVDKSIIPATKADGVFVGIFYMWGQVGRIGFATAIPVYTQPAPDRMVFEEAFRLTPDQLTKKAEAILIDGDGHQHKGQADFAVLLK
jgi:hypothetical protein